MGTLCCAELSCHRVTVFVSPVEGHDSSEDARACMELMVWKIKEDAKVKR